MNSIKYKIEVIYTEPTNPDAERFTEAHYKGYRRPPDTKQLLRDVKFIVQSFAAGAPGFMVTGFSIMEGAPQ